jgi:hypothetical protein
MSGNVSMNVSLAQNSFKVILNQNVTSCKFVAPTPGLFVTVMFAQDATGNRTVKCGGNIQNLPTVTSTAFCNTSVTFQYDSSTNIWNAVSASSNGQGATASPFQRDQYNKSSALAGANPFYDLNRGGTPYFDVKAFCASGSQQQTTGSVSGAAVTLASAIDFAVCPPESRQPGEGIRIYHAGAAPTISAPTGVTARAMGRVASAAHTYQIVANDYFGGATAATATVTVTNSPTTLGTARTYTITNTALTSNVVTVTANNSFTVGQHIYVVGTTNGGNGILNGFWVVISANSTSFTYALNHANIARATDTGTAGGTDYIDLCLTPGAGAGSYSVYRDTAYLVTTFDSTPPSTTYCYEDTNYNANGQGWGNSTTAKPDWLPSTPPGSAVNDWCDTTIASGAGTTALTLSPGCPNSVTSQTVKHQDTAAVQAAVNATNTAQGGRVVFPIAGNFNIGNIVWPDSVTVKRGWIIADIQGQITISYPLTFGTPVQTGYEQNKIRITGGTGGSSTGSQFPSAHYGLINSGFVSPVIHTVYQNSTSLFPLIFDHIGIFNRRNGGGDGIVSEGGNSGGLYIDHTDISTTGTALKIGYGGTGGSSAGPCTSGGGFGNYVSVSTFTTYFNGNPLTNCDGWTIDVNSGISYFDNLTLIGQGIHTLGIGTTQWNNIYEESGGTLGFLTWDTRNGECTPYCGFNTFRHVLLADGLGAANTYFIYTINGTSTPQNTSVTLDNVNQVYVSLVGGATPIHDCTINQDIEITVANSTVGNCHSWAGILTGSLTSNAAMTTTGLGSSFGPLGLFAADTTLDVSSSANSAIVAEGAVASIVAEDTSFAVQSYFDSTGALRTAKAIISTLPVGTAPLNVASTTVNPNLNSQLWNGQTYSGTASAGQCLGAPSGGTAWSPVTCGSGPIGATGATGAIGPTGIQGITGPTGATGAARTGTASPFSSLTTTCAGAQTWALGGAGFANASITLTGACTLNLTGPVNGGNYVLEVIQGSGGSHTLTLGTGCTWKVSGGGGGAVTPSTAATSIDVLAFTYDGTNCYANYNKLFN